MTAAADEVVITFSTPGGRPESSMTRAKASDVSGVCAAGLSTIVQPAATAGATLRVAIASGKFHGVISRHGPTGRRDTSMRLSPAGELAKRPLTRTASSENQRRNSAP